MGDFIFGFIIGKVIVRVFRALLVALTTAGIIAITSVVAVVPPAQAAVSNVHSAGGMVPDAAVTSASMPCVVSINAPTCKSTDPDLTVDFVNNGDTSGCTFTYSMHWGDGSPAQQVTINGEPQSGEIFLADHTYHTTQTRTYSIMASPVSVTGGCTSLSGSYTFTLEVGAPTAPSNLTVTAVDPSHIRLDWQANSNNQTGFQINNGVVSRNVGATSTTYTWGGLAPSTYMCFKIRAYNSVGASAWVPKVSPFYKCTTTPAASPKPVVVTKTALSADTVMGVTVMASFSPAGAGGRLKLNYLWFDASAPGLRCDAGITAKGIRIISNSKTVWQVATGPTLTFGPGIGGSSKNAYIYLYGNPTVYVTGGKAFIAIGFNLFSSLLSPSGCADATLDTISMHIPIP